VLAAVVVLDRGGPDPPEVSVTAAADHEGGHQITVTWPDGLGTGVTLPVCPS
jgi:hypothetical protein